VQNEGGRGATCIWVSSRVTAAQRDLVLMEEERGWGGVGGISEANLPVQCEGVKVSGMCDERVHVCIYVRL